MNRNDLSEMEDAADGRNGVLSERNNMAKMRVLKQKECHLSTTEKWQNKHSRTSLSISTERQYGAITRASTMDLNETSRKVIDYQEAIKNPRTFKYIHQTSSNKTRKLKRKLSGRDVHDEECEEWVLPKAPSGKGFIIYPTGFLLCGFTWDAGLHRASVTFILYKGKAEQPPSHLTK
ncbi:hypothetical protein mRhiFer1_009191 [Rhinolophus ferrumequinum]|uniref:Uncharacterized protein n=1 Tax=Rhinolophus ferrumequinum TaxID=59479 RepID=A0A7J7SJN4_RHIFE|nr:hypothetical protein mRhiFer1_009191 [Rhinolophus ferrumequinum]